MYGMVKQSGPGDSGAEPHAEVDENTGS